MMLIPLGRETRMVKVPYVTIALIVINTVVFFKTWPAEKKYATVRFPHTALNAGARRLVAMTQDPAFSLPQDLRDGLTKESEKKLFPTPEAEGMLERANHEMQGQSWALLAQRKEWDAAYEAYEKAQQAASDEGAPAEAPFYLYAFDPSHGYFPGLFTHMFLHAGYMHVIGNMLILWIVGVSIEERWGPLLFLALYVSGGMIAGLTQEMIQSVSGIGAVGASGAVAAVMGAFLIRHYNMPIKFFYAVMYRMGTAVWPAWTLLVLWFGEQVIYAVFSDPRIDGSGVAYGAHAGGFVYGALIGWFVLRGGLAATWEKSAATSRQGMEQRDQEIIALMADREFAKATERIDAQLKDNPLHVPALLAAARVRQIMGQAAQVPPFALRAINGMLAANDTSQANVVLHEFLPIVRQQTLSDKDDFGFGQCLARLRRYPDALEFHADLLHRYPQSSLVPKALLEVGKIYRALKQPAEAERYFRRLLEPPHAMEWSAMAQHELRALSAPQ